jgi:ABC-type transport system involved in multi-copper enzyme maturation permease subunit
MIIAAEWVKFRSLRSLAWTLLATMLLVPGLGAVFSFGRGQAIAGAPEAERAAFDPTQTSLSGILMAQIAVAALGALMITSEFAGGTIRPSLAAVPGRTRLLAAKAALLGTVVCLLGAAAALLAFGLGQRILAGRGAPSATLADGGVARAVLGAGLYLAAAALLGLALGVLLRSTAGAVSVAGVVLLIVPIFSSLLPASLAAWIATWWPSLAGLRLLAVLADPERLSPWAGTAVLAGYVCVALAAAFTVFRRRDV